MITRLRKYATIGGWVFYVEVEEYELFYRFSAQTIDPRGARYSAVFNRSAKVYLRA